MVVVEEHVGPVIGEVPLWVGEGLDEGEWLVACLGCLERGEAVWLERLDGFDARGWAADGCLSCVDWLVARAGMARSTAFEKLRVARQLRRRPGLADAYRAGRVGYSALRAICRAEDPDPAVDDALVTLAEVGSLADVEHAVRAYRSHRDQEHLPAERRCERGLRLRRTGTGLTRIDGLLSDLEADQLGNALRAILDVEDAAAGDAAGKSAAADSTGAADAETQSAAADPTATGDALDEAESAAADWWDTAEAAGCRWAERRADALMELVAQWAVAGGPAAGAPGGPGGWPEGYLTHVVVGPDGTVTLLDGTPVDPGEAAAAVCGSPIQTHHLDGEGRLLRLGRRRRRWSPAQRLAALARDGGRCRFPGCHRPARHLHHAHWWSNGGPTDLANATSLCHRHHTLAHHGAYRITGDADTTLRFTRNDPTDQLIGTSRPVRRTRP